MIKKQLTIIISLLLLFVINISCFASDDLNRREYAFGWQFSRPANGFSVKIPIKEDYYLQPIFAVSMAEKDNSTQGHYALGLRGIYHLPIQEDFQPYVGVALGYSENFEGTSFKDSSVNNGGTGYEAFFGVEYQKYLIRPALEIGLGGFNKFDHTHFAGLIANFSVMYYF